MTTITIFISALALIVSVLSLLISWRHGAFNRKVISLDLRRSMMRQVDDVATHLSNASRVCADMRELAKLRGDFSTFSEFDISADISKNEGSARTIMARLKSLSDRQFSNVWAEIYLDIEELQARALRFESGVKDSHANYSQLVVSSDS